MSYLHPCTYLKCKKDEALRSLSTARYVRPQTARAPQSAGPGLVARREMGPKWRSGALWSGAGWQVRDPAATPTFTDSRGIAVALGVGCSRVCGRLEAEFTANRAGGAMGRLAAETAWWRPPTPTRRVLAAPTPSGVHRKAPGGARGGLWCLVVARGRRKPAVSLLLKTELLLCCHLRRVWRGWV